MSTDERDPRVDPRPGDVLAIRPGGEHIRVVQVGTLIVVVPTIELAREMLAHADQWSEMTAGMEVISRGQD